ncbi:MAG: type II toxin-antitoxin system Phd/YefM family antitoxin [Candidatus Velthaea sp.]
MAQNEWQIQEAKGRFSAVLTQAQSVGPQRITKHGQPIAVILSLRDYERLTRPGGASIVEFFAKSPLSHVEFAERDVNDVVRDVEL